MKVDKKVYAMALAYKRAVAAAENAAEDAATIGWWRRGGAEIELPCKSIRGSKQGDPAGNFWVGFISHPYTTSYWGEYVPSGALACAAAKAITRATGLRPNDPMVVSMAVAAAAEAGEVEDDYLATCRAIYVRAAR